MRKEKKFWSYVLEIGKLLGILVGATLLGDIFRYAGFPETNIVVIYIFAILLVARFTKGYLYGIVASVIGIACFNYFFTRPYHTLRVDDPSYLITFVVMLITALMTSALTSREKWMRQEATRKGRESQILYHLSNQLSDASEIDEVIKIAVESFSSFMESNIGCMYVGDQVEHFYYQQFGDKQLQRELPSLDQYATDFENLKQDYLMIEQSRWYPVYGHGKPLAFLVVDELVKESFLIKNSELFHTMLENLALAIERIEITLERMRVQQNMQREMERANLLRAISHDLRTPLSGIMGTAEMLMDMTEQTDGRQKLLHEIYQDADWLKSLVENILSMTRIQDGKITLHKEMEALEEIIASAVMHVEKNHTNREIGVDIPEDFQLVPVDAKLIEQVITNLLENAIKHTKMEEAITIAVEYTAQEALVTVFDEGEGIAKEDEGNLFQIFYTSKVRAADVKKGIGLGLTICKTVVEAHGGTILGRNRKDGKGAEFQFTLPLATSKNSALIEE